MPLASMPVVTMPLVTMPLVTMPLVIAPVVTMALVTMPAVAMPAVTVRLLETTTQVQVQLLVQVCWERQHNDKNKSVVGEHQHHGSTQRPW